MGARVARSCTNRGKRGFKLQVETPADCAPSPTPYEKEYRNGVDIDISII